MFLYDYTVSSDFLLRQQTKNAPSKWWVCQMMYIMVMTLGGGASQCLHVHEENACSEVLYRKLNTALHYLLVSSKIHDIAHKKRDRSSTNVNQIFNNSCVWNEC